MSIRINAVGGNSVTDKTISIYVIDDGVDDIMEPSHLWIEQRTGPIQGYPLPLESANRVHTIRSVTPQANALRAQSSPTLSMSMESLMSATLRDGTTVDVFMLIRDAARLQTAGVRDVGDIVHTLNTTRDALKDAILADGFVRAYLTCALWSSTMMPEDSEASDLSYDSHGCDIDDVSLETAIGAKRDCDAFQLDNEADLELADENTDRDAHNFWLSRNGHGAGFFDRCDDVGTRLQDASRVFGEVNLYHVGDDCDAVIYSDADVDTLGSFDLSAVWS